MWFDRFSIAGKHPTTQRRMKGEAPSERRDLNRHLTVLGRQNVKRGNGQAQLGGLEPEAAMMVERLEAEGWTWELVP